jgi:hypothetical protein
VQTMFDEAGTLKPEFEAQRGRVERAYKELIWMAEVLRWGRQNRPR